MQIQNSKYLNPERLKQSKKETPKIENSNSWTLNSKERIPNNNMQNENPGI